MYYSADTVKECATRFNRWLKRIKVGNDDYYLFMISETQETSFQKHLTDYNIKEFIIAERHKIINQNYRGRNRPPISWYVLNFPADYKFK